MPIRFSTNKGVTIKAVGISRRVLRVPSYQHMQPMDEIPLCCTLALIDCLPAPVLRADATCAQQLIRVDRFTSHVFDATAPPAPYISPVQVALDRLQARRKYGLFLDPACVACFVHLVATSI